MAWLSLSIFTAFSLFYAVSSSNSQREVSEVSKGNTEFTLSALRSLTAKNDAKNYAFSPWSISLGFAMLAAGARGGSLEELVSTFKWKSIRGELHDNMANAIKTFQESKDKARTLTVAAKLWVKKGTEVKEDFLKVLRQKYKVQLGYSAFKANAAKATEEINAWIKKETKNKIKELFPKGSLDSDTRVVLADAVYFKGKWLHKFAKRDTKKTKFIKINGESIDVKMMFTHNKFNFGRDKKLGCRILELPYSAKSQSMIIILPDKTSEFGRLLKGLSASALYQAISNLRPTPLDVFLPSFHVTTKLDLNKVLTALGTQQIFTDKADLSGVTGHRDLFVSTAVHQADIEVNEEGTTAEAGTGVGAGVMSMPTQFVVNRPFLFFIKDSKQGIITFAGRVADPSVQ